jgi:hypothetical protein
MCQVSGKLGIIDQGIDLTGKRVEPEEDGRGAQGLIASGVAGEAAGRSLKNASVSRKPPIASTTASRAKTAIADYTGAATVSH